MSGLAGPKEQQSMASEIEARAQRLLDSDGLPAEKFAIEAALCIQGLLDRQARASAPTETDLAADTSRRTDRNSPSASDGPMTGGSRPTSGSPNTAPLRVVCGSSAPEPTKATRAAR